MPTWASTLIVVAVALLLIAAAVLGWRSRVRRDAGLVPSHDVPADLGAPLAAARVLYVATTAHDEPLERLAIAGLAFRAQGTLAVYASGIVAALDGGADVWIPASAAIAARPATVAIDKAVEKDGLLNLTWRLGETRVDSALSDRAFGAGAVRVVDSYFRVLEPEVSGSLYDAIDSITHAESEV